MNDGERYMASNENNLGISINTQLGSVRSSSTAVADHLLLTYTMTPPHLFINFVELYEVYPFICFIRGLSFNQHSENITILNSM